jgi:hypothetical protein
MTNLDMYWWLSQPSRARWTRGNETMKMLVKGGLTHWRVDRKLGEPMIARGFERFLS